MMMAEAPAKTVRRSSLLWRRVQWALLGLLVLVLIAIAAVWVARKPIANNVVASELEQRGVQATYTLDRIGLHTQQVSNLVIGDPANPDLTARRGAGPDADQVERQRRILSHRRARRAAARGAWSATRSAGARSTNCCRRPAASRSRLPNIVVDVADTTIALRTPYGPIGFALQGRGNLAGGFKGKLAASAPRLTRGHAGSKSCGPSSRSPSWRGGRSVVGPVGANSFTCPASRLALSKPRMEIDATFSEAFGNFDGKGRLSMASVVAGVNGLAAVNSNLTFKGTPDRASAARSTSKRSRRGWRRSLPIAPASTAATGSTRGAGR